MYPPSFWGRLDYCVAISAVICFLISGVYNKEDASRKTYTVRYTNGDLTIPVTVVLDYNKQAEYVINMNPRTPTKSVTFYDFKQKSIAYKDMSNRECFIGKLTHETLQGENEQLKDVQNPVTTKPILLNLDGNRFSLTPTEVRNIAGQKIAMFCRKMAAWLLQETNVRTRRQADHRIERTSRHLGQERHEYSRHGQETYEVTFPQRSLGSQRMQRIPWASENKRLVNGAHESQSKRIISYTAPQIPLESNIGNSHHPNVLDPGAFETRFPSIPLYKPPQNASFNNTSHRIARSRGISPEALPRGHHHFTSYHPRRQEQIWTQSRQMTRMNSGYGFQLNNYTLPTKLDDRLPQVYDRSGSRWKNNHLLPRIAHPEQGLAFNRRVDARGNAENSIDYFAPQHFQYSHQLRRSQDNNFDGFTLPLTRRSDTAEISEVSVPEKAKLQKTDLSYENIWNQQLRQTPQAELKSGAIQNFEFAHLDTDSSNQTLPFVAKIGREYEGKFENSIHHTGDRSHEMDDRQNGNDFPAYHSSQEDSFTTQLSVYYSELDQQVTEKNEDGEFPQLPSEHNQTSNFTSTSRNHSGGITAVHLSEGASLHTSKDRSDIPHEDFELLPLSFVENGSTPSSKHVPVSINSSLPNTTLTEGVPPRQERLHNALKLFTPDEIVIDIGQIPEGDKIQPVDGSRGHLDNATVHKTRRNETINYPRRKQYPVSGRRRTHKLDSNSFPSHRAVSPVIHPQIAVPRTPHVQLPATLPPGVSIYPRRPSAPFAPLAPPSGKRTFVVDGQRTPIHHQRHRRKKLRKLPNCCGQELSRRRTCCKGSQCCSSKRFQDQIRTSCCKSRKTTNRPSFTTVATLLAGDIPQKDEGVKGLCDVKRKCRTLYQSTKSVKVCKLDNVPGC